MNETRNIIVGLEIGKNQSQICYYDRREKEPISVSVKAGSNQYLFPTRLSKKPGEEVWHYGMEADYFSRQEGGNFHYRTSGDFWKRGGSHRGRRKKKAF